MTSLMLNRTKRNNVTLISFDKKDFHLKKHLNCRNHSTTDPNAKFVDSVNRHQSSRRRSVLWLREQRQLRLHQSLKEDPLDQVKYKQFLIKLVLPMLLVKDRRGNFVWIHDKVPCHTINQDSALVRGIC